MTVLVAQTAMVLFLALWITIAVRDNIVHAHVNRDIVTQVLTMALLKEEYPIVYASHARRSVDDERLQKGMFALIVVAECIAAALLWIGFAGMLMAIAGSMSVEMGHSLGLIGALAFTCVWSGFLIGGNYWCYWMCHDGAQKTHFHLCLLGLGTMILLAQ